MSKINKNARIKDNLEGIMSQKGIKFNRNMSDPAFVPKMERQFLEFPNGDHEDIIDTVSQGIEMFRRAHPPKQQKQEEKPAEYLDPVTRQSNATRGLQVGG